MSLKSVCEYSLNNFSYDELVLWEKLRKESEIIGFLEEWFKIHFRHFVWLMGHRDLGRFHYKELDKLCTFRFLTPEPVRMLFLWSRGFFKTSVLNEDHNTWLIVNNPDIRILTTSFTLDIAKKPLNAVRNQFMINEDFRLIFKDFCPIANKDSKIEFGTSENFTIPNRTKNLKEPTMLAAGIGTNVTGLHFDLITPDDLVNRESVTNDTQIQATKDYFSLLNPLFDNPTIPRFKITGTTYHFNDLHSELRKNTNWVTSVIPVHDENGNYLFPERIPKEKFEQEILGDPNNNPFDIYAQYLLNPIDPAQIKFHEEWIKYYDKLPDGLSEYVLCDPASSVKHKADYTVIERWGVDKDANIYLIDGIRDKVSANTRVQMYVNMAKQCKRLKGAKYEVIGGRHGDLENIRQYFIENKLPVEPSETKATSASKQDRIEQRLIGQFHAGKIFFPRSLYRVNSYDGKSYDFVQEYLLEYRQFPFSEHDDILDCHSQLFDGEIIRGLQSDKLKQEENEFDWWRKQAIQSRTRLKERYVYGTKDKYLGIPTKVSYR